MALDPQAKSFLERAAAAAYPPLQAYSPTDARRVFEKVAKLLDAPGVPIGATRDRRVPGPATPIPIRTYRPSGTAEGEVLPAILFFHGGGFVVGSIESHDVSNRLLADAARCAVVSVDYRLAPEHKFPAAVEDCLAATRWAHDHAEELGIARDRLAVAGDSAGGNLAAVTALLARQGRGNPPLKLQLLIYPVTNLGEETASRRAFGEGYLLTRDEMQWFHDSYTRSPEDLDDWRCSPLLAPDLAGLPPAYVVTAGYDPLRDEGIAYAERLRQAGVPTTLVNYEGMVHGFWNMSGILDETRHAIEAAAQALRSALQVS